jgi:hypothetical protein
MRALKALVVILIVALFAWHVRRLRGETRRRGVTEISTLDKLRSITHDLILRDQSLDHAITLTYAIDLRTDTTIKFAPEINITGGPVAFDVLDRPVPIQVQRHNNQTSVTFAPPPPAMGAARQITIAFTTDAPPLKYGWGYRARPLPWATTLAPPRIASMIHAHVPETVSASGWGCTYGTGEGRICALSLSGRRRSVAVPMEPASDTPFRLAFGAVLGTAISFVMYAIYRRWSVHAKVMETAQLHEIDPFEAVALVARGIVAVLGLIGSIFLVGHFGSGFFPIMGPLALTIWAGVAGVVIVVAAGIDRPRPWVALALLIVLGTIATIPAASWILPGLPPLLAASLMQFTAK